MKYNTATHSWKHMGNLIDNTRFGHSCAFINDKIIVSGGTTVAKNVDSTEIIPVNTGVPRMVRHGELKVPRRYFGMMAVGGRYPQIMAFGGKGKNKANQDVNLQSIEIWDSETEKWRLAPFSMNYARNAFGFLAVPESTICNM